MVIRGTIKNRFGICRFMSWRGYVYIFDLYIYPRFRRQGKATMILNSAVNRIQEKGYNERVRVVARPLEDSVPRERLVEFYNRMGFEVLLKYPKYS